MLNIIIVVFNTAKRPNNQILLIILTKLNLLFIYHL